MKRIAAALAVVAAAAVMAVSLATNPPRPDPSRDWQDCAEHNPVHLCGDAP